MPRTTGLAKDDEMLGVADPVQRRALTLLARLFRDAQETTKGDSSAASLATASADARPSVRVVNIASISARGVLIFANKMTGKALQMQQNPRAALCFYWPSINQQINLEGAVSVLSDADADAAWTHRPREAGLGHWASDQTGAPDSETGLRQRLETFRQKFTFERVPRPADWRGYVIQPDRIEFWRTGWGRLKSRTRFKPDAAGGWTEEQLNP